MTDQHTEADVAAMRAAGRNAEIEQARLDGRLDDLLGIERHRPAGPQWTQDDVNRLFREKRYDEIAAAAESGALNDLFNGPQGDDAA